MKEIARVFGTSVSTVSRALSDSPRISKATREAIQRFAAEHNYTPNIIAESLRHSRTKPMKTIGVIVPEVVHHFFCSVLAGIEEEATERGYRVLFACSHESYEREVAICRSFYENKVCGIIISQAKDTHTYDHFKTLVNNGVPMVFYDRICTGIDSNRVVVDDYAGAFGAVAHLLDTGCRRIAYLGADLSLEISKNRLNGYKDALARGGIAVDETMIRLCDTLEDALALTPTLMALETPPDAFFAVNDDAAIGALQAVKRLGFRVPEEIAICGFSNADKAIACDPQLTTVEQRGARVGREAAAIVIDKNEGRSPMDRVERRVVKTRLVQRGTTRHK